MSRRSLALSLLCATLFAVPAFAAPPFGYFDGILGGRNAGGGFLPLTGWALATNGIARIEIWVDGKPAGTAFYSGLRPDVTSLYPGYLDSSAPGFSIELNSAKWLNGQHTVAAYAFSKTGEKVQLGSYSWEFLNTVENLVPFGAIDFPQPSTQLFGRCDPFDRVRRYAVVEGYAVDTGIETLDTGVKYVELLINGGWFANSVLDCYYDPTLGGWVNCFGLPRPEIKNRYPSIPNALNSGYRFVMDIGELVAEGFDEGFHELTIRAGDYAGQVAIIGAIPVVFRCDDRIGNEGSFGEISLPVGSGVYGGVNTFLGWALDWEGVARVKIYIDGASIGDATYGIARPEVTDRYPGYPDSAAPGWQIDVNAAVFTDGVHSMQAIVVDKLGFETVIGETSFIFDSRSGGGLGSGSSQ